VTWPRFRARGKGRRGGTVFTTSDSKEDMVYSRFEAFSARLAAAVAGPRTRPSRPSPPPARPDRGDGGSALARPKAGDEAALTRSAHGQPGDRAETACSPAKQQAMAGSARDLAGLPRRRDRRRPGRPPPAGGANALSGAAALDDRLTCADGRRGRRHREGSRPMSASLTAEGFALRKRLAGYRPGPQTLQSSELTTVGRSSYSISRPDGDP